MVLVAEGHRLSADDAGLGEVRRLLHRIRQPAGDRDDEDRAEDARLGDGVKGGMKYLGHAESEPRDRAEREKSQVARNTLRADGSVTREEFSILCAGCRRFVARRLLDEIAIHLQLDDVVLE